MAEIASFVFFDLETTGLPWQERNQTKITEFSFVAASREGLQMCAYGETPLLSKLTFVLNPERPIHPEVIKLTGLTNDLLRHAPVFSQKITSIIAFLEELPKPVCLVAHNGNIFDYKILLAECKDADVALPEDLLSVDSLVGFRTLLKNCNTNYRDLEKKHAESVTMSRSNTSGIFSDLEEIFTDDEDEWPDLNVSSQEWDEIDDICLSLSDASCDDVTEREKKTKMKISKAELKANRSEAIKKVFSKSNGKKEFNKINGKKEFKSKEIEKTDYKLKTVYKRLLNRECENAHRAEADCLVLAECVVALKDKFLPWADGACQPLTHIRPLIRY